MTKAKPPCSACGGSGSVNVSTGGGTEPRTPGTPAVYGVRLSREPCPECQQRAIISALSVTDEPTPNRTKETTRVGDGKTTAPVDDVINALRAGTNRQFQQAAAVMLGRACLDIEQLQKNIADLRKALQDGIDLACELIKNVPDEILLCGHAYDESIEALERTLKETALTIKDVEDVEKQNTSLDKIHPLVSALESSPRGWGRAAAMVPTIEQFAQRFANTIVPLPLDADIFADWLIDLAATVSKPDSESENQYSLAFKTLHAIYHERDFRVRVNDPTVDLVEKVLRKLVNGPMDNKRCPACEAGFENDDSATLLDMVK